MKKLITQTIIGIVLLFFCSTCYKEHISPVNQLAKNLFCFQAGSEWTYYDSISHVTRTMTVTDYSLLIISKEKRGINCAELIEIDFSINDKQSMFMKRCTSLRADFDQDNTIIFDEIYSRIYTPTDKLIGISCDKDNNFTPSATYLSIYSVNGITYSDVYVFEIWRDVYYVSEHIGFIRCIDDFSGYDWILVDKKVQQ